MRYREMKYLQELQISSIRVHPEDPALQCQITYIKWPMRLCSLDEGFPEDAVEMYNRCGERKESATIKPCAPSPVYRMGIGITCSTAVG